MDGFTFLYNRRVDSTDNDGGGRDWLNIATSASASERRARNRAPAGVRQPQRATTEQRDRPQIRWRARRSVAPRRARTSRSRDRGLALARTRGPIQADIPGRHAARAHRRGNSRRPRAVEGGAGLTRFAAPGGLLERCRRLAAGDATRRGNRPG